MRGLLCLMELECFDDDQLTGSNLTRAQLPRPNRLDEKSTSVSTRLGPIESLWPGPRSSR